METTERIISFDSGGLALHGLLYEPVGAPDPGLLVICDPFAEEKKCAHRPLTDTARALAAAGHAVLRFDYRGCGDSEGDFLAATPEDWVADIRAAVEFARRELPTKRLGLAGLRLGASLAARAAEGLAGLACLILWEPVIDGKQYVTQNLRRSMIKAMLTEGEGFDAQTVASRHEADVIDFDGYEISAEARRQLEAVSLAAPAQPFAGAALVLNIASRDEPSDPCRRLAASFAQATALGVRLEPFWNRIGLVDAGPMIQTTLQWLGTAMP